MEVVAVNLTGVFLCTQEAFKIMKDQTPRGGRMKIMSSLEAAGFEPCSFAVAERIRTNVSARDYLDRGVLTKESTSQLTLLEDKEYEAGITRIRTAVQEAEARGEDLKLRADLCLYATFGTVQR